MDRIHHRLESAMNDIGQVGPTSGFGAASAASRITEASAAYRASAQSEIAPSAPRWAEGRDRVELSEHARHLDAIRAMPDVRMAKVEAIKQAIASGTYESPEKLQTTIDGLLRDLNG
jgi:negative regulator of flagellin synthesis FlgM